jgi:hypothetical protein
VHVGQGAVTVWHAMRSILHPSPTPQTPPIRSTSNLWLNANYAAQAAAQTTEHVAQGGMFGRVLSTFCNHPTAPPSAPPPPQASPVSASYGATVKAGVTVTTDPLAGQLHTCTCAVCPCVHGC